MAYPGKRQSQRRWRPVRAAGSKTLCFEMLEGGMLLSTMSPSVDMQLVHALEPDHQTVQKDIVAGDPNGTPPDTPVDRVDPNTTNSKFGGVGSLFMDPGTGSGFLCTGTVIGPATVLTASSKAGFVV